MIPSGSTDKVTRPSLFSTPGGSGGQGGEGSQGGGSKSSSNLGPIIGGVVGGIVILLLALIAWRVYAGRRRRGVQQTDFIDPEDEPQTATVHPVMGQLDTQHAVTYLHSDGFALISPANMGSPAATTGDVSPYTMPANERRVSTVSGKETLVGSWDSPTSSSPRREYNRQLTASSTSQPVLRLRDTASTSHAESEDVHGTDTRTVIGTVAETETVGPPAYQP